MAKSTAIECDALVVGSGLAGLHYVLTLARLAPTAKIVLVTKAHDPHESASRYAQGGIAAVFSQADSIEAHVRDTLEAGAGLCQTPVVELCVTEGPERIQELIEWGVPFTKREDGALDLTREGGHTHRRILHAADHTGQAIVETLMARVAALPNLQLLRQHVAVDLITDAHNLGAKLGKRTRCLGAYFLDEISGDVLIVHAKATFLATGGAARVYRYTTNPTVSSGDGIAMAYRAGARVANLEFMQFHPTCLYHPEAKNHLLSEALRGEGALLRNHAGEAFMKKYHPLAELAPRDIVSLSIDREMKSRGDPCVFLDISHRDPEFVRGHFPLNYEACLRWGFDLTKQPVPVVPAAHYTCGGVVTDLTGATNIQGLYAAGEVAHTGLHGANRLASNSLLEALVFSERAAQASQTLLEEASLQRKIRLEDIPPWDSSSAKDGEEEIIIQHCWEEIRAFMWNYVGIVRTDRRLEYAARRVANLRDEVQQQYWDRRLSRNLIELRNLLLVADLIVRSAQMRKESRGLHQNLDHPETDNRLFRHDTVL